MNWTHNTPGIAGLNAGVKFILETGINKIREHEESLCEYMLQKLTTIPNIKYMVLWIVKRAE